MPDTNRKIQELLSDYAGSLRDGCVPVFLKSLTRQEGRAIAASEEFWDAAEVVRILNGVGFADKAVTADVGLFMSRVDASIVSRLKKAKTSSRGRRPGRFASQKRSNEGAKAITRTHRTEKPA